MPMIRCAAFFAATLASVATAQTAPRDTTKKTVPLAAITVREMRDFVDQQRQPRTLARSTDA